MKRLLIFFLTIILVGGMVAFLWAFPLARTYSFSLLGNYFTQINRRELQPLLEIVEKRWQEKPLTILVGEQSFLVDKRKLGVTWNLARMRSAILKGQKELSLSLYFDEKRTKTLLQEIAQKTALPPQNASFQDQRFVRSQEGKILDVEQSFVELREKIESGAEKVELTQFVLIPPEKDTASLLAEKGFPHCLSRYETSLEDRDDDVVFNIQKAAAAIDGFVLKKGTTFSFNQLVGKAEREDGYRKTQIVVNGKLVPGYGGGVCQVSTTLYNAVLYTEAQITERYPHSGYSPTTSYVPPGRDAAVSYGVKDLRFRFPDQNVVILAYLSSSKLVCEIWGEKENTAQTDITVRIVSLTRENHEDGLLTVQTTVVKDGKIVSRLQDTYRVPWDFAETLDEAQF